MRRITMSYALAFILMLGLLGIPACRGDIANGDGGNGHQDGNGGQDGDAGQDGDGSDNGDPPTDTDPTATITIIDNAQPQADIIINQSADTQIYITANFLAKYIQKSTGCLLAVLRSDQAPAQPIQIHVGETPYVTGLGLDLSSLDDDGFVITFPDNAHIVILGPSVWGTKFGVYEFLERYLGVRWLMPGENGEHVPIHSSLIIPIQEVQQEPAFFSRLMSGWPNSIQSTWARRNRMHGRISFHHNLYRLFPPETYTSTNPEFYPILNGERFLPPADLIYGWQPCFTAAGIVDEAILNINNYFASHTSATSYSLGVNDSGHHCECAACQAKDNGLDNYMGYPDLSDRYFEWANAVAAGVLLEYPDKWFGCLAYSNISQPPSIGVHERIVPYITHDRMKWLDATIEQEAKAITELWHSKSPVLGWYDYIYGTPYCLPRVYFHKQAEYYRYAKENGVQALYAEAYPNWGEGPKLYIAFKLQWNPDLDVDALLSEWYDLAVGPAAASDLAAYYALWENFWTVRIPAASPWFSKGSTIHDFRDPEYLQMVTQADIDQSRSLLESAAARTTTPQQHARAQYLLKAFEYYEASVYAYQGARSSYATIPVNENEALQLLNNLDTWSQSCPERLALINNFESDPILIHPVRFDDERFPKLWFDVFAFVLADWMTSSPIRNRMQEISLNSQVHGFKQSARALLAMGVDENHVIENTSFEQTTSPWGLWVKWGIGTMERITGESHSGTGSILCTGLKRGGPYLSQMYPPGEYAAVGYVKIPENQTSQGTAQLTFSLRDSDGNSLKTYSSIEICPNPGVWTPLGVCGDIVPVYDGQPVEKVQICMLIDGFAEGEKLWIDDVMLFKNAPP